jgi:hypothetical protein
MAGERETTVLVRCAGIGFGCGRPVAIRADPASSVFMVQCADCVALERRLHEAEYDQEVDDG